MRPLGAIAGRWTEIEALLDEAFTLATADREPWLQGLAGDRAAHRETLRELLAMQARIETDDFLADLPRLPPMPHGAAAGHAHPAPGGAVGPYRLIEEIGSGGMGTVWLAERADGTLRRRVALKLPRFVWGDALADRMARERDILSTLAHPHIARLYDAGVDVQGRPYLAMEHVHGEPIDAYVRRHALGLRERIGLLLQVMAAVAHAHAQLVVHRDLKPGNVLVTAEGQARLLDFGIAKLLEDDRTRETALTALSGRALTLDYASPEQIRGEPLGTASDIYSMGVVAYEVLAGRKPYRLQRGSAAELEEAIAGAEPPLASAQAEDPATARGLRGDLDAILNHALRKSPDGRYPTMDAFALDLQRFLRGEPVEARPDGLGYRAARYVGRHRLQVGASALVATALLVGSGVAVWQAREARAQAARARAEAGTSQAVQRFLEGVFMANRGDQAHQGKGRDATARELLDRGAARIDTELADAPEARLRLLGVLASMYEDMALHDQNLALRQRQLALARSLTGATSDATVTAMTAAAHALASVERREEAAKLLREAGAILDARHDTASPARLRFELAQASYDRRVDPEHGWAAAGRALTIARRSPPGADLVLALELRGDNALYTGRHAEAKAALEEAVALVEADPSRGASVLTEILGSLGNAQAALGELAAAEATYRKSMALTESQGSEPAERHFAAMVLANFLYEHGRYAESLTVVTPAARWARTHGSGYGTEVPMMVAAEGRALVAIGRAQAGLAALDDAVRLARPLDAAEFDVPVQSFRAAALVDLGRLDEARGVIEQARARAAASLHESVAFVEVVERDWWVAHGEGERALASFHAARVKGKAPPAPPADARPQVLEQSARFEIAAGHAAQAETQARQGLAAIAKRGDAVWQRHTEAQLALELGRALLAQGRATEAVPALEQALALHSAVYEAGSPRVASATGALQAARRAAAGRKGP